MRRFDPIVLSSSTVHHIFIACVAVDLSKEVIKCVLFQKDNGFPSDSKPIFFDKEVLEGDTAKLEYMLGQLKDVHNNQSSTNTTAIKIKYDDTMWTDNNLTIIEFLHLCCAANLISPLRQNDSSIEFLTELYPTISPLDRAFFEWLDEHKPKILELIAKENGQEPADE